MQCDCSVRCDKENAGKTKMARIGSHFFLYYEEKPLLILMTPKEASDRTPKHKKIVNEIFKLVIYLTELFVIFKHQ